MEETQAVSVVKKTCKRHIKGDTEERTDVAPFTDLTDAAPAHTSTAGNNSTRQAVTPSYHRVEQDNIVGINLQTSDSNLEPTRVLAGKESKGQDAEQLTTMNMKTKLPTERLGTINTGCAETPQDRHAMGVKREHSHSPVEQSSPISQTHLPISHTCAYTAAGSLVEPGENLVVDGEAPHRGQKEGRQPRKRMKFVSENTEVEEAIAQTLQEQSTFDHHNPSSEVTAATPPPPLLPPPISPLPPATTRSIQLTPRRPTVLLVSELQPPVPQPVVTPYSQAGGGGDDSDIFPRSREEETPDGGVRELVVPSLHSLRQNNGEIVTPEKQLTPPNTVFGHVFPPEPYRRQLSDNNAQYHALRSTELHQERTRRQNSEPTTDLYRGLYDNNGRLITENSEVYE